MTGRGPALAAPVTTSGGAGAHGFFSMPRGPSSCEELDIRWDYPLFQAEAKPSDGRSQAVQARQALPAKEAYARVAADDQRPLLVLRECLTCTGTDDALLTRQADNEKTMLMSRWFHCVKLPPDVVDEDHPAHELFPGEAPAHLFVARWNGTGRLDLDGAQSRTELWSAMERLLASEYVEKSDAALDGLFELLVDLDILDGKIGELEHRLGATIEAKGSKSSKVKKVQKQLTELRAERADVRARAVRVSQLKLRQDQQAEHAGQSEAAESSA